MAMAKRAKSSLKGARGKAGKRAKKQDDEERAPAEEAEEIADESKDEAGDEDEAEAQDQSDEETSIEEKEEQIVAARRKELKCMSAGDVKQLAEDEGVEPGNKADMIDAIVEQEARHRAEARAHEQKLRDIVTEKKDELEALSLPELRDRCNEAGIKGNLSKQARVELLLKQWQDNDGVDKGLKKRARDEREQELEAMDKVGLHRMCDQVGLNAIIKEVVVERLVRRESELGRFRKPSTHEELGEEDEQSTEPVPKKARKSNLVEALLANEASRKKELERKKQAEEEAASRRKELRAMSVDELKKDLAGRGRNPVGKKDELVEQLFVALTEDEAVAAKKTKLKASSPDELKRLLAARGLEVGSGKKDAMVEALLEHEAKMVEEGLRHAERSVAVLEKKREELEAKTGAELRDLCISKGLKQGMSKEDRVDRLLDHMASSGEVDIIIAATAKEARRQELLSKEQTELLKACRSLSVDPLVKEVLVERILEHEDEFGRIEFKKEAPSRRVRRVKK